MSKYNSDEVIVYARGLFLVIGVFMTFSKASSPQPSREWRGDAIYGSLWVFLANPGVNHEFGDQRVDPEITSQPLEARLSH